MKDAQEKLPVIKNPHAGKLSKKEYFRLAKMVQKSFELEEEYLKKHEPGYVSDYARAKLLR